MWVQMMRRWTSISVSTIHPTIRWIAHPPGRSDCHGVLVLASGDSKLFKVPENLESPSYSSRSGWVDGRLGQKTLSVCSITYVPHHPTRTPFSTPEPAFHTALAKAFLALSYTYASDPLCARPKSFESNQSLCHCTEIGNAVLCDRHNALKIIPSPTPVHPRDFLSPLSSPDIFHKRPSALLNGYEYVIAEGFVACVVVVISWIEPLHDSLSVKNYSDPLRYVQQNDWPTPWGLVCRIGETAADRHNYRPFRFAIYWRVIRCVPWMLTCSKRKTLWIFFPFAKDPPLILS